MSGRVSLLVLDPHAELRAPLYAHWGKKYDIEITGDIMGCVAPIVKNKYTVVFCPVLSYALDVPYKVAGVDIAQQVVSLNDGYVGRFLYYCTPEVCNIANTEGVMPPKEETFVINAPVEELLDKADEAVECTIRRSSLARCQ